jgi:hypothetical protein
MTADDAALIDGARIDGSDQSAAKSEELLGGKAAG